MFIESNSHSVVLFASLLGLRDSCKILVNTIGLGFIKVFDKVFILFNEHFIIENLQIKKKYHSHDILENKPKTFELCQKKEKILSCLIVCFRDGSLLCIPGWS